MQADETMTLKVKTMDSHFVEVTVAKITTVEEIKQSLLEVKVIDEENWSCPRQATDRFQGTQAKR